MQSIRLKVSFNRHFLIVFLFFFISIQQVRAQDLINGDFETGDLTGWINSGTVLVISSIAIEGVYSLNYNGGDLVADGMISQAVSVTIGAEYELHFSYGYLGVNHNQQMDIQVDGLDGFGSLINDSVLMTTPYNGPQQFNQSFIADTNLIILRFSDVISNDSSSSDMMLDSISLNEITDLIFENSFE